MSGATLPGDEYVLQTGEAGAYRLELLDRVYGPETRRILWEIGIPPGAMVADIGCGTGTTTVWLAKAIGSQGEVAAVDISTDQMKIAAQRATAHGVANIRFGEASAYDTGLPRSSFDIVHCRFL